MIYREGNVCETGEWFDCKSLSNSIEPDGTYWGNVVVNREYMDKEERERFLTGYEEASEK